MRQQGQSDCTQGQMVYIHVHNLYLKWVETLS